MDPQLTRSVDQSVNMSSFFVQTSENMSARHETIDDHFDNLLFDDIQDLLDSVGHDCQDSSGYEDELNSFASYQVMEDRQVTTTVNDEKHTTKDNDIADDTETDKPDILHLVDEVFSDIQNQENNKQDPFNIPCREHFNQRLSEVSDKKQNNDKVRSDEDQICSDYEGALAILSPVRSSVIVSDKIKKPASQKPSADLCPICGALAGKHRYYGGKSCGPCRAFFRRSVQSKYFEIFHCKSGENCTIQHDSRKKCQFCRFKKCLEAGMKTAWVLSEEQRNQRFNKLTKLKIQNPVNEMPRTQPLAIPEVHMKFTIEEHKSIEELHQKFQFHQQAWLKTLFLQNNDAGLNVLEALLKIAPIRIQNFKYLEDIFHLIFTRNIVPKLLENADLPAKDIGQLINGRNSAISHMFKLHQFTKMDHTDNDRISGFDCSVTKQVSELADAKELDPTEYITELFTRLKVGAGVSMPTYADLYPEHWAMDKEVEDRHKEISRRIQKWPTDANDKFDYPLVLLLSVILLFNPDHNPLVTRSVMTNLQSKYVTLLQRYIRSKLDTEAANAKFIEAMLLLSVAREMWDLSRHHQQLNL